MATNNIFTNVSGDTPITVTYTSTECNLFTMYLVSPVDNAIAEVTNNNPFTVTVYTAPLLLELLVEYDTDDCDDFTITSTITSAEGEYCEGTDCSVEIEYIISSTTCIVAPEVDYNCTDGLIILNYNPAYTYTPSGGQFFPANQPVTVVVYDEETGCTNSYSFIAPDCCEDILITPEYDCDTNELTITLSGPGSPGVKILLVNMNPTVPPNSACPFTGINPLYDNPLGGNSPLIIPNTLCNGIYGVELIISLDNDCTTSEYLTINCDCNCEDTFYIDYTDGTEAGCDTDVSVPVTPINGDDGIVYFNNNHTYNANNTEVCVECGLTDVIILADVSASMCPVWGTPTDVSNNPDNIYMSSSLQYLVDVLNEDNNSGVKIGFIAYNASNTPVQNVPLTNTSNSILYDAINNTTCTGNTPCATEGDYVNNIITTYVLPQFVASTATKKLLIFISDGIMSSASSTTISNNFSSLLNEDVVIATIHVTIGKESCGLSTKCIACEVMKCLPVNSDISIGCSSSYCTCDDNNLLYYYVNTLTETDSMFTFIERIKQLIVEASDESIGVFPAIFESECCGTLNLLSASFNCNECENIQATGSTQNVI